VRLLKICKKCTLNDNIFSVSINDDGLCNYCRQYAKNDSSISSDEFEKKEKQLAEALNNYMDLPYQVLLAYSGGKDSTYTLYLLRRKYNVSVLAVTFDNGFLTEQCRQNIHEVTANLGVDSITIKPSFSNLAKAFDFAGSHEIFPRKSLERASSICTACIGMIKSGIYKEAIMRRIPFVSFGWTPGQVNLKASIVKLDYKMILANQKQIEEPIV
jgi:predicted PP-loop superfamily ATPase